MKLTPARFIESYARLGVRFELQAGVVVSIGASPAFCEWVSAHSDWLRASLNEVKANERELKQIKQTIDNVESTDADRLVWAGIQNARKNEAKVKAIKGSRYK